eukprot:6173697-Pleurochrysis_carterae.AAC.1
MQVYLNKHCGTHNSASLNVSVLISIAISPNPFKGFDFVGFDFLAHARKLTETCTAGRAHLHTSSPVPICFYVRVPRKYDYDASMMHPLAGTTRRYSRLLPLDLSLLTSSHPNIWYEACNRCTSGQGSSNSSDSLVLRRAEQLTTPPAPPFEHSSSLPHMHDSPKFSTGDHASKRLRETARASANLARARPCALHARIGAARMHEASLLSGAAAPARA